MATRKAKQVRPRPPASASTDQLDAEKLAALAEFAAGAGHEINNPLTVIAGRPVAHAQRERSRARPGSGRDRRSAMRITEMIADLRLFATCPELERQPLDIAALAANVVESLRSTAAEQETTLVYVSSDAALQLTADPTQLTVAIRALCQNALESLGFGGRVEVAVASAGGEARISVSETAPAFCRPACHIFEPFYSARQAGRGIGMGLSKCWRIVTGNGGRINVESRPGSGAVFTICLPWTARIAESKLTPLRWRGLFFAPHSAATRFARLLVPFFAARYYKYNGGL